MLQRWPLPLADTVGIPNSCVQAIFQSDDDVLWFATTAGVGRYDANTEHWRWFSQHDGLIHNNVSAIQQSRDGRVWFATFAGGVSCFEPHTEQWQTYSTKDGLLENTAQALLISELGDASNDAHQHPMLWLGTSAGLSCYDFVDEQWQWMNPDGHLAGNDIQAIYQCHDQRIWFATTQGLSCFDPITEQWRLLNAYELGQRNTRAIVQSDDGVLWLATTNGLISFNLSTQRWQAYTTEHGLLDNDIRALALSADNSLWIGSTTGLNRFDLTTQQCYGDTHDELFTKFPISSLYQDRTGILWVGTVSGLECFEVSTQRWFSMTRTSGLIDDDIRTIYQSDDAALWFATGKGISRFDAETCQWQSFASELIDAEVLTMQQDERNLLWFGTHHGISQLELASGRWRRFVGKKELVNSCVQTIYRDRSDMLWFGTSHSVAVHRFNPKLGQWRSFVQRQDKQPKSIQAILQSDDGDLWFATRHHGVLRLTPNSERWKRFHNKNGLAHDNVQAICQSRDGTLWFATLGGGVSQFDPATQRWQTYTEKEGLVSNRVQAVHESADGVLWFGSEDRGISRFDQVCGEWRTLSRRDGLLSQHIRALWQSADGTLWIATDRGANGIHIDSHQPETLGGIETLQKTAYPPLLALNDDAWVQTRAGGLSVAQTPQDTVTAISCEHNLLALVGEPSGGICYGGMLSGLRYSRADAKSTLLTKVQGLPANSIYALALLPHQPQKLWVATAAGAALVTVENGILSIERRLTCHDNLPSGPVNTLLATAKGGVFLAYNAYYRRWIFDPELARQRRSSQVRYLSADGNSGAPIYFYRAKERLNNLQIRALAWSNDTLWAATSAGLFKAEQACTKDARFHLVSSPGSPQTALRQIKVNPTNGELWLLADAQQDVPARVIGYDPISDETITLTGETDVPAHLPIHDLAINADGELAVLAGSQLFKGFIKVRKAPVQAELPLAPPAALPALAKLLAMQQLVEYDVKTLQPGLLLLEVEFNCPDILHGHPIPIIGADINILKKEQINPARALIRQQLAQTDHRFELPFLIYCRDAGLGHRLIVDGFDALVIDEVMLKKLLNADSPQQMFSGLLFTRGLLAALSPYRTEGAVHDPAMFYGRGALLRKLIQIRSPQFLLVGPRRVGKSSLLRRLTAVLPSRHPDLQLEYIDLLGIKDPARVTRNIARKLKLPAPPPSENAQHNAMQLADLLRERFVDPERPGLLLIDEADGIVETDAKSDFPLLSELRSLQAEGLCSFILAGYWYLFRWTLDHHSPVHNFASVERLGPLEQDAGYNLVSEPMERLGVRYENPEIANRIVAQTGSYPSLIQFICDQMLEQLKREQTLVLTEQHLQQVEQSQTVRDYLSGFFRFNTGPGTQILVYQLLEHNYFSVADAHRVLEQTVEKEIPLAVIERMLLQLVIFGLVSELNDRYRWTIPLVRSTLRCGKDRDYRVTRLLQELPVDYSAWITPMS